MLSKAVGNAGKLAMLFIALAAIIGIIVLTALSHPVPEVLPALALAAVSALAGAAVPVSTTASPPTSAGINLDEAGEALATKVAGYLKGQGLTLASVPPAAAALTVAAPSSNPISGTAPAEVP